MKAQQFVRFIGRSSTTGIFGRFRSHAMAIGFYVDKKDENQVTVTLEASGSVLKRCDMTREEFDEIDAEFETDHDLMVYFYNFFGCRTMWNDEEEDF